MHRISPIVLALAWLLLLAPGSVAQSEPPSEDVPWTIENFRWNGPLESGSRVFVRNLHGDIRSRSSATGEVVIAAMIQRHPDDPDRAEVRVVDSGRGLDIEVSYPAADGREPVSDEMARRRVDVSVLVPEGVVLVAETDSGLIELKGVGDSIDASSNRGDIVLSTAGQVRARSAHGRIQTTLRRTAWQEPMVFETVTGDIVIWFARDTLSLDLRAQTSGDITTDFSIAIERPAGGEHKSAAVRFGEGCNPVMLTSVKGAVEIRRLHL